MNCIFKRIIVCVTAISLFGCASAYESAEKAVSEYNEKVAVYMEDIKSYNETANKLNANIQEIKKEVNASQESINKSEKAFDPETLTKLKEEMVKVQDKIVSEVEVLPEFELIEINENMTDEELKTISQVAKDNMTIMNDVVVPDPVEVIDYSSDLKSLSDAHQNYKDSVQSLKQITAPSDQFVMDRLMRIENITEMGAVTEDNDPNGKLNKAGGYIGTIYYTDINVDRNEIYIEPGKETPIDVGTKGGGAIEIYPNVEDAKKRDEYLGSFDGSVLSTGAHNVYGTVIIRISDELTASQQEEMTQKILDALTYVDK